MSDEVGLNADARLQFQHRRAPRLVIVAVSPQFAQFRLLRQHPLDDLVCLRGQVGTRLLRPPLDPRVDARAFLGALAPVARSRAMTSIATSASAANGASS